jgi:nucleoid DNA-binding protein
MNGKQLRWLGGLTLAAVVVVTVQAQNILTPKKAKGATTFLGRIAEEAQLAEEDVEKVLQAFGPAIRDELAAGKVVEMPGLGVFRVVRIPEHRDMVNGRPAVIPATNYVEFLPVEGVVAAANARTAVPAETVPAFEYTPLPNRVPSTKIPNQRIGATRTR